MDAIEFGIACKEYNIQYRNRFGVIPIYSEYACNREQFLVALKKAVAAEMPIETYLQKRVRHEDGRKE